MGPNRKPAWRPESEPVPEEVVEAAKKAFDARRATPVDGPAPDTEPAPNDDEPDLDDDIDQAGGPADDLPGATPSQPLDDLRRREGR